MSKGSKALERIKEFYPQWRLSNREDFATIETALKDNENLKEENKLLRENNENLDENYYDTWYACERLKENSNYALMFVDGTYCLVDTKDNKFDVVDEYKINNNGIIDNGSQKKLKALEIIKELILKDNLFFNDKEQEISFFYDISTLNIKIKDKTKYDLLKEVLK